VTRAELLAVAAVPCHECGNPVTRVEMGWRWTEKDWRSEHWTMVCAEGHRVAVEPFPESVR
jgi:hypothetical protein